MEQMRQRKAKALQLGDFPRYSRWQAIYMAFYSSHLYIDVAKRWRGFGIIYLLLMIACATVPLSVRMVLVLHSYFNEQLIHPLKVLPPLFIHNGEFSFEKPMPYYIKNKADEVVAIIDTTGKVKGINSAYYPMLTWLVTKKNMYYRMPPLILFNSITTGPQNNPVYTYQPDPDVGDVFIGREWLNSTGLQGLSTLFLCIIYPCIVFLFFGFLSILLFGLAALAQFFARVMFKLRLEYRASFRLVIVALTPPIMISWGLLGADRVISGSGYFFIALFAAYFCFGVVMLKRCSRVMVRG